MGVTEIVLLMIGAIILVLGYVLPVSKKKEDAAVNIDEGLIKELIDKELKEEKAHINDMVDETLNYSMEKTERQMEKLTNEKIMAVSEYSDTVLESIHKNHQEVMFLYDMLNDKHDNLVKTVGEASVKAKEIKQTVQDAEITVREVIEVTEQEPEETSEEESSFVPINPPKVEVSTETMNESVIMIAEPESAEDLNASEDIVENNNDKILRLHKLGKSTQAIAKELELGVGEVKLVIDLFQQSK